MRFSAAIPAMPVQQIAPAAAFYERRFGFTIAYAGDDFAKLLRDGVELHLWLANDRRWQSLPDLRLGPVRSGAESFLAGTASCRIEVDAVEQLHDEMSAAKAQHLTDLGDVGILASTAWGTTEFAVWDHENNLLTFFRRDKR